MYSGYKDNAPVLNLRFTIYYILFRMKINYVFRGIEVLQFGSFAVMQLYSFAVLPLKVTGEINPDNYGRWPKI